MNSKPLTLKWRPKNFNELIGQHHILKLIENSFLLKRIQNAYLISGIKGIGKTSLARLIAKCLNCKNGVTFQPCQICRNCRESDNNCFIDLIEIDAASYTKIEYIKEVLDTIKYAPSKGKYKIYIIDEAHMLSKYSFNALLKILEEPPLHAKFILATTEILKNILTLENVNYEEYALDLIAQSSQKSMRNALSLTEKALILGNNRIISNLVSSMLGKQELIYAPEQRIAIEMIILRAFLYSTN
uniref:DNA-directed DNA polymerase n=1 Tax=Glossina austeni TaxID=7395 RepID=A0A1A9UKI3_GLOAU